MELLDLAMELVSKASSSLPDLQFIAVCPKQDPEVLLHLMSLGIRETVFPPDAGTSG